MKITKQKIMKNLLFISLLIISTLSLTSCTPKVELNKRGLIHAIVIDYKKNMFDVSFQMFNASSSSPSEGPTAPSNDIIINSKGKTIVDAMKKSCLKQDQKIYYRLTNVIILGESIIKNKDLYTETINFLNLVYMSSPKIYIIASEHDASEIINAKTEQKLASNFIQNMLKNAEKQSYIQKTYLLNLNTSSNSIVHSITLPTISVQKIKDNKDELTIKNIEVITDNQFKGEIPTDEMIYHKLLDKKKSQISFNLNSKKYGLCNFNVIKKNINIKSSIIDDKPHFDIDVKLISSLLENSKGYNMSNLSEKQLTELEILQNGIIKYRISHLLNKALKKYKSDIFYFTNDLYRNHYEFWNKHKNNWSEVISKSTFSLNVQNHIYRSAIEKSKNY